MITKRIITLALGCLLGFSAFTGQIETANALPPQSSMYDAYPAFMSNTASPLVMLVMGRNHKLYYEAYNDASDLNGDGELDITYKPDEIDYYGYFDSYKYYEYTGGQFVPVAETADKKVPGSGAYWSGDFLNYLTMSRMDAIRKVLYGGYRSTDTATETVLERAYIPQDAHSWGKEYESIARDGYDIREYAPLPLPSAIPTQTRHLFASTSIVAPTDATYQPLLRVMPYSTHRIWEWVAKEGPVADNSLETTGGSVWQIVPNSAQFGLSNVTATFYATDGYGSHPGDHADYDTLVANYAIAGNLQGTQSVSTINGSGNPFDADNENYLTIFDGTINVPAGATYTFAVDGDDAVELLIDADNDGDFDDAGEVVAGYYGGHGDCGCNTYNGSVYLSAGSYSFQFRHQEGTGGDEYYLRWQLVAPASQITDLVVRVKVADSSMPEANCKRYPNGEYKPVGLLQRHGETDSMYFGLLTGSYAKNTSGGVLRKNISSITDEIDPSTGQFTAVNGIIKTINTFRITEYNYSGTAYNPMWPDAWITTREMTEGEFPDWGNPIGEMMFEALRYFGGEAGPTSAFHSSTMTEDDAIGLPNAAWSDPYASYPQCAKPFILTISDIYPTYDSDQLPGSAFGGMGPASIGAASSQLNVESIGDLIFSQEESSGTRFIGENSSGFDGACTAKDVDSLGDIRGLCPEEPTKQGSYSAAAVAHYGRIEDLNPADADQQVRTYAVGLASPLPKIEIPLQGKTIRLVPFAKSVGGCLGIIPDGPFQPTNTIVDFFVERIQPHYGRFRINYEDVEQAADHDMDAIVTYEYILVDTLGNPVTAATIDQAVAVNITLNSEYASGCIIQHAGYIISGTTHDGTYLEVRDIDTNAGDDPDYFLDTPDGVWADSGGTLWDDNNALPLSHTRTFTVDAAGGASAANLLPNPLWYAAKWGGFKESPTDANNLPDQQDEWDKDNDGVPDTYFYVVNPLKLEEQLSKSFADILSNTSSGTAAAVVANNHEGEGNMIQAFFKPKFLSPDGNDELTWLGYMKSFWVDPFGHLREDSNNNFTMDFGGSDPDRIIEYDTDIDGNAYVKRYTQHFHYDEDNRYTEESDECLATNCHNNQWEAVGIEEVEPIFAAGEILHQKDADSRVIFTFIDGNGVDGDGDGQIDQSGEVDGEVVGKVEDPLNDDHNDDTDELIRFHADNYLRIKPFLGLKYDAAVEYLNDPSSPDHDTRVRNLINYIRGKDSIDLIDTPNTRNRTFDNNVWKLGDIVHSTPVIISRPPENYHTLYGDKSFLEYYRKYKNRETMVYVGANDGMLHAFTHGRYIRDEANDISKYEAVGSPTVTPIGEEVWAYVPQTLLPHLKWLADPDYGHSFYVDMKPKIFDARIFPADTTHPGGWGTLLLLGLGTGGKEIWAEGDFGNGSDVERRFYPTYTLIDITEPRNPKVLWERSYENLGMTSSFPAVVQVGASFDTSTYEWNQGQWLAVFGSGPHDDVFGRDDYRGYSDQNGRIFVVDLFTGDPQGSGANDWLFDTGLANAVMNSPTSLDKGSDSGVGPVKGLTYNVDAIYFGSANYTGTEWQGNVLKINTRFSGETPDTDPGNWSLATLFNSARPITAPVSLTVDMMDNVWVLFGTGRFMEMSDRINADQQYLFGIKDPYFNSQYDDSAGDYNNRGDFYLDNGNALPLNINNLFYANPYRAYATTRAIEVLPGGFPRIGDWESLLSVVRNTEDQGTYPDYFDGWYRELDPPLAVGSPTERIVSKPAVLGGAVFVPAYVPDDDICGFGGITSMYGLFYETGTPAWLHVFKNVPINTDTVDGKPHERVNYKGPDLLGPPPPVLSVHTGREGVKLFSQAGTGPVDEAGAILPYSIKSRIVYWYED